MARLWMKYVVIGDVGMGKVVRQVLFGKGLSGDSAFYLIPRHATDSNKTSVKNSFITSL